ncbi:MAG TPA: PLP-dependent aspartate aminotransferase family protein [Anaerolineae bacterium]|nr:PLP-dependent aspartate aminotransferase family protein [Anaerolineae bacterium]
MTTDQELGFQTLAVHAGEAPDPTTGALVPPLSLATTYHLGTTETGAALFSGEKEGYVYTRWSNPTVSLLERRVAALEGAEAAIATSSGMAAISTALLANLRAGDHVVAAKAIYPSTYAVLQQDFSTYGVETTFVDATDIENVADAIRPNTRVVYLETPGNPLLAVCDLQEIARIAREAGAVSICDNTFATPVNQNPIALGIDIVLHSATKYLCGHGDAVGGLILGRKEFIERTRTHTLRYFGGIMPPFNAYLITRGTMTLPLRMKQHNANAFAVARFLEQHPAVASVSYPGLDSHPQHLIAKKQMRGFGGMVSFELKGGLEAGARMMDKVRLCSLATSLGDARTLISHPATTSHVVLSREERLKQGVSDGLVRLSVGIEDEQDIIADLAQAME